MKLSLGLGYSLIADRDHEHAEIFRRLFGDFDRLMFNVVQFGIEHMYLEVTSTVGTPAYEQRPLKFGGKSSSKHITPSGETFSFEFATRSNILTLVYYEQSKEEATIIEDNVVQMVKAGA